MKQLIIIGGANGTGKTTFAKPFVKEKNFAFLNADEITKELSVVLREVNGIFGRTLLNWLMIGHFIIMVMKGSN